MIEKCIQWPVRKQFRTDIVHLHPQNFSGVSSLCLDEYANTNVILKIPTERRKGDIKFSLIDRRILTRKKVFRHKSAWQPDKIYMQSNKIHKVF